jgi:hypothetical protein
MPLFRLNSGNNINDMMHLLGHLFHNLSDLHINIRDQPPRQIHTMNSMQSTASINSTPIEASILIPLSSTSSIGNVRNRSRSSQSTSMPSVSSEPRESQRNFRTNSSSSNFASNSTSSTPNDTNANPRTSRLTSRLQNMPQMPFSFGANPMSNSYDEYLPCQSVHFYSTMGQMPRISARNQVRAMPSSFQRRRHPAGDQQPASNTTFPTNRDSPQMNNNPLNSLFSNIFSTTIENLTNLSNQGANVNNSSLFPQNQTFVESNRSPSQLLNLLFNDMFKYLNENNSSDHRLNQTLKDYLHSLCLSGEINSLVAYLKSTLRLNLFNVFYDGLTLNDAIGLMKGSNIECLEKIRNKLRNYLENEHKISVIDIMNSSNLRDFIDKLYADLFENKNKFFFKNLEQFKPKSNRINFERSFHNMIKYNLKILVLHIFDTKYDTVSAANISWSRMLYRKFQLAIEELFLLVSECFQSEQVHAIMIQLLTQMIMQQETPITNSSNLLKNNIEKFLKEKLSDMSPNHLNTNRTEIESFISFNSTSIPKVSESSLNTDSSSPAKQQSKLNDTTPKELENRASEPKSSYLPASWKPDIPSEWIPMIESDIEYQEKLPATVRPFSDAYNSGIPSKKRRVLLSESELTSQNVFERAMRRTLDKVKPKQNISEEEVLNSGLRQERLLKSFDTEFETALKDRLKSDPDYNSIINSEENVTNANSNQSDGDSLKSTLNKNRFQFAKKKFN